MLRSVEVILLVRYRDAISGRVLELGCGAGRLTGYLAELATSVVGLDISPAMIDFSHSKYPYAEFAEGDLRDLSRFGSASFDTVLAPWNVLDVLTDSERGDVLDQIHRILGRDGLLIMSSHNEAASALIREPTRIGSSNPLRVAANAARLPLRLRNRRRLRPLEQREGSHAILNDSAHNYSLLHYYIGRDRQAAQLEAHGFQCLECLDLDGRRVEAGERAAECPELHYAARAL